MSLPALLKEIADKHLDGRKDAFWQHKQSGQWLIKHRDLEIAAGRAGISFDVPTMYESTAGQSVAMLVVGHYGDKKEWSIGEASPKNTQQTYPYAMAEKRAKDRVILKLFGIHGHAYSEEEADTFKADAPKPAKTTNDAAAKAAAFLQGLDEWVSLHNTAETYEHIKANAQAIRRAATYPALASRCADYLAIIEESV